MPLILRQQKGSKLTIPEMDGNLTYLEGLSSFSKKFQSKTSASAGDIATLSADGKVGSLNSAILNIEGAFILDTLALPNGDILSLIAPEKDGGLKLIRTSKTLGEVFNITLLEQFEFGDQTFFNGIQLFLDPQTGLVLLTPQYGTLIIVDIANAESYDLGLSISSEGKKIPLFMNSMVSKGGNIYFTSRLFDSNQMDLISLPTGVFVGSITIGENPGLEIITSVPFEEEFDGSVKLTYHQNTNRILASDVSGLESVITGYSGSNTIKSVNFIGNTLSLGNTGFDLGTKLIQDATSISIANKDFLVLNTLELVDGGKSIDLVSGFSIIEVLSNSIINRASQEIEEFFVSFNIQNINRTSITVGDTVILWGIRDGNFEDEPSSVYTLAIKINSNGTINSYNLDELVTYGSDGDFGYIGVFSSKLAYSSTFGYVYNYLGENYVYSLVEAVRTGLSFDLGIAEQDWKKVIGLYESAVNAGELVDIKLFGLFENSNFDLTPGLDYYLGSDNSLTQYFTVLDQQSDKYVQQTSAFEGDIIDEVIGEQISGTGLKIGKALSADTLFVNITKEYGIQENEPDYYDDYYGGSSVALTFSNVSPAVVQQSVQVGSQIIATVNGTSLTVEWYSEDGTFTSYGFEPTIANFGAWGYALNPVSDGDAEFNQLNEGVNTIQVTGEYNISIYPTEGGAEPALVSISFSNINEDIITPMVPLSSTIELTVNQDNTLTYSYGAASFTVSSAFGSNVEWNYTPYSTLITTTLVPGQNMILVGSDITINSASLDT